MSIGEPDWPHKLGKKPARPDAILFRLANYINMALPKPPTHFRHGSPPLWEDFENTKYGDCVIAGAANETRLWEHEGGLPIPPFTSKEVLATYSLLTGFNPNDPSTDSGTDMGDAAAYRRKTGLLDAAGKRHKIDAYAAIRLGSADHLKAAMWILGGVGLGFKFPKYAMDQFEAHEPWTVKKSWTRWIGLADEISGGHYVPAVGIAPNGNIICVSWGREHEMTMPFYLRFADEVTGFMDLCRLSQSTRLSPEGFDQQRLLRDLTSVASGRIYRLARERTIWA